MWSKPVFHQTKNKKRSKPGEADRPPLRFQTSRRHRRNECPRVQKRVQKRRTIVSLLVVSFRVLRIFFNHFLFPPNRKKKTDDADHPPVLHRRRGDVRGRRPLRPERPQDLARRSRRQGWRRPWPSEQPHLTAHPQEQEEAEGRGRGEARGGLRDRDRHLLICCKGPPRPPASLFASPLATEGKVTPVCRLSWCSPLSGVTRPALFSEKRVVRRWGCNLWYSIPFISVGGQTLDPDTCNSSSYGDRQSTPLRASS